MKRILIFSLAYYPRFVGGAEIAVKEITDRLGSAIAGSASALEFDIITLRMDKDLPKTERIGNVTIHRIGFAKKSPTDEELLRFPLYLAKVLYPPLAFWKAVRLDRKMKYDALWSIMSYMGFPAIFFLTLYRKIPFILTLQDGDSIEHVTKRRRIQVVSFLYKAIFRRATAVQVISQYLGDFARSMGYKGTVEIIPNGVDLSVFSRKPSDTELFALKEKLNKKYTDTFLITTSRLVPKNAVGDIIEALTYLPATVRLLVIGSGPQEAELKELVHHSKLSDRVDFFGFVPHSEIPKFLFVSDIFVRPSLSEGFGNSFIEAMAADLPVIATPVGGIVDFLHDKQTGLFCKTHDPESIASAVKRLMEHGELRDSIVSNAKEMVSERYDWDLVAENMKQKVFAGIR